MSRSPSRAAHDHQPVIAVRDLTKTYVGQVEAVKSITFDVQPGEVFGLLGPNGAGKSTTIGMLTTAIRPTSGTAHLRGIDVLRDPLGARSVSSVVFQDAVVDKALSGRRNLELHGHLWGVEHDEIKLRVADVAVQMGLSDEVDRPVGTYSGGQRRRLEIGRALMSRPEVLFLDEPTVGLDPRIRFELLDLIAGLRRDSDTTVLLTTHYLDEAERLCDRVAIMHSGRIVALDTPAALLAALGAEILEVRVDGDAATALKSLRASTVAGQDSFAVGNTLTVPLHQVSAGQAISAVEGLGLSTRSLATRAPTLDDVYLQLTGNRLAA
jgi:ABC-2 type transport system ATP-binding protein